MTGAAVFTAKLNGLNPEAYLTAALDRLTHGHSNHRLDELGGAPTCMGSVPHYDPRPRKVLRKAGDALLHCRPDRVAIRHRRPTSAGWRERPKGRIRSRAA